MEQPTNKAAQVRPTKETGTPEERSEEFSRRASAVRLRLIPADELRSQQAFLEKSVSGEWRSLLLDYGRTVPGWVPSEDEAARMVRSSLSGLPAEPRPCCVSGAVRSLSVLALSRIRAGKLPGALQVLHDGAKLLRQHHGGFEAWHLKEETARLRRYRTQAQMAQGRIPAFPFEAKKGKEYLALNYHDRPHYILDSFCTFPLFELDEAAARKVVQRLFQIVGRDKEDEDAEDEELAMLLVDALVVVRDAANALRERHASRSGHQAAPAPLTH